MVKFCKQFEALLVPEWKDAFVDYRQLKKDLKNSVNKSLSGDSGSNKDEIIQVRSKTELYETAGDFFTSLDFQLNKVNQFYKGKEKDFVERGDSLKKQMELLLQLKEGQNKSEEDLFCADRGLSLQRLKCDCEKGEAQSSEERGEGGKNLDKARRSEESKLRCLSTQPFSHSGKSLEIDIPLTTPLRAISALSCLVCGALKVLRSSKAEKRPCEAGIDKAKLRQAQKMIRGAYIELYKGLGFLETYRNMNMLAFAKILSKFDEVMQKQTLPVYLKVVESSYFNTSIKAVRLMDEVEDYFTQHFADGNKKKAFQYLKPIQQKESHAVTFLIGLFTGCFIALLAGYCIMARIAGMYTSNPDTVYMETVYPVLCVFCLFFLHLFLYGCNIIMWRKTRINYRFIFELSPNNELKYRDVFLICSTSMTIVVGTMFAHLSSIYNGYTSNYIQAVPGILLLVFVVVLLCPINIIYRSSRFKFLRIIRNIIFSPFYKVFMVDFFMADQLCSQVPMLRSLEYATCYYITRSYKTQDYKFCTTHFITLAYAVSFLPYYWRAMQCARRWFDEGETSHLVNLGKYVSAILAAGAKIAYEKDMAIGKFFLVVVLSCAATVYQLYWDFVKDWGLLQPNSKNPWLRDELILHRKSMYFLSMGLNLVLRLAWIQSVLHSNIGNLDYRVISFFLAALEVIRRGHWNFYRLENEHLNNVGKFRAVKTVPLPFHGVGQD